MRPDYETAQDLLSESAVARKIEASWYCTARKLPRFYHADYALLRSGVIEALLEIKCRPRTRRQQYSTYILSVAKMIALDSLASAMNVKVLLAVQWSDALGYADITRCLQTTETFSMGGRMDRNDPDDVEPIIEIPIADFTIVRR